MPDIVAGNTSTTAVAPINVSVYGTIDTLGDHDWYRVTLTQGTQYEFRLHGIGVGELADPYLRIRDSAGTEFASNDDAGAAVWGGSNRPDSRLVFTPAISGTYYLDVGAFNEAGAGNFLLSAVESSNQSNDPNVFDDMWFTSDEVAWQLTNNFWEWSANPNSLPAEESSRLVGAFNVGADGALSVNITQLTAAGQFLARNALLAWSNVTGITFVETAGVAEITFDDVDPAKPVNAVENHTTTNGVTTSSNIIITTGWLQQFGTGFKSYSFETYIHEIGHALGLGHGGNYNGSATFGDDNFYMNDSTAFSIMSYMQAVGDEFPGPNTNVNADFRYMLTPAIADVIAVQLLYGDHSNTRTGNTTYGFGSNTGNAALDSAAGIGADMAMTVYDDGGIDTLNFSNTAVAQQISLIDESWSSVWGGTNNLSIARGTIIEAAIGGSGADTLTGNSTHNILEGGAGADVINGNGGNDWVSYEHAGAGVRLNLALTVDTGYGGAAAGDDITNVENIRGSAFNDFLYGDAGANILRGDGGADVLYGGANSDTIYYSTSAAAVTVNLSTNSATGGDAQGDTLVSVENVFATRFNDVLIGDSASNTLVGWLGVDSLRGNGGNDIFRWSATNESGLVAGARDVVADFFRSHGDLLDFRDIDAIFGGANDAFNFIGTGTFTTAGQLRYFFEGSNTVVQINTDANPAADMAIQLAGNITLLGGDFML